jgi:hypothetical protein
MAQQVQVLLIDDLDGSQAEAPSASGWTAPGTGSAGPPGMPGRRGDTWRAAWLPPGGQAAAGGRPSLGAGHR